MVPTNTLLTEYQTIELEGKIIEISKENYLKLKNAMRLIPTNDIDRALEEILGIYDAYQFRLMQESLSKLVGGVQ